RPSLKAAPLSPTICSVDRFVRSSEPAMIGNVRLRPPRKNPSELARSSFRVMNQVSSAAAQVKAKNETSVQACMGGFFGVLRSWCPSDDREAVDHPVAIDFPGPQHGRREAGMIRSVREILCFQT